MDEPKVDAVVEPTATEGQLPKGGEGQPQPDPAQEELRKLQSAKDREIAAISQQNQAMAARLEAMEKAQADARIASIEDPDERAQARIAEAEAALRRKEQAMVYDNEVRAKPIAMALMAAEYGVPLEALQPARSAQEMENLALKWKLAHVGKELEKSKKPEPPAATAQKFNQGAGSASSAYDPAKYRGTGDIAGSLRAKREAGL